MAEDVVRKWKSELNRLKQSELEAERQKNEKRLSDARIKRDEPRPKSNGYAEMRTDNHSDSHNSTNSAGRASKKTGILIERQGSFQKRKCVRFERDDKRLF